MFGSDKQFWMKLCFLYVFIFAVAESLLHKNTFGNPRLGKKVLFQFSEEDRICRTLLSESRLLQVSLEVLAKLHLRNVDLEKRLLETRVLQNRVCISCSEACFADSYFFA